MAQSKFTKHVVTRLLLLLVFASNMYCALMFFLNPADYTAAYQLAGEGAEVAIAGMGVAFAMWNATYIPLIVFPYKFTILFWVVLAQQCIGLAGETYLYLGLGPAQAIVASSIMRFIIFDAVGLVLLIIALTLSMRR